jgi:hypothetical protein
VVDEKSAAASERAGTFIMTCWYRKPLIQGDEIVDEWVERLVCWDEVTVDVDRQTIVAFNYGQEAARLREELRAARLERIAAAEAAARQAREDRENELREQVLRFVLDASRDDDYLPRYQAWALLNDRLRSMGYGLDGEYPDLLTATRIVHLIESARAGKPVGFGYKSFAELGHHLIHQHPELLLAFGHMLRRFGTKEALYRDDRTGKLKAKLEAVRADLLQDPKYGMADDEERLCAFLSQGACRKARSDNDNPDQSGQAAA